MKFSKISQLVAVTALILTVASFLTACGTRTIDYVYLACAAPLTNGDGQIQIFAVDSLSGALRTTVTPVDSGGPNPVAEVASPNFQHLYVVNQGNNTVVHFEINDDSSLTQKDVLTLSSEGNTPVAVGINQAGTFLFVVSAYQPAADCNPNCTGTLSIYPLTSGAIGAPVANGSLNYWPLRLPAPYASDVILPTGISVLNNGSGVLVSAYDTSAYDPGGHPTSIANSGLIYSFNVASNGAVTAAAGSPYNAGVKATSVASDPSNRFVYVTDYASNELVAYRVADGNTLTFLQNGPFKTGYEPTAITIDPRGLYIYVTNALDNTVSAYDISLPTGTPSVAVNPTGSTTNTTDTRPVALTVEPSLGRDVYTANYIGNSISGFTINSSTGTIKPNQATPYPALDAPTAIVSVAHGNYSLQQIPD
jgi:6-phosphogluconolactonase (cycloisomerase 2 family)